MSAAIRAEKAAKRYAASALRQHPSPLWARAFGVHESRVRHWISDDPNGPVERTLNALLTGEPGVATAIKQTIDVAWEHRVLLSASASTLISRWHFLWHHEPEWDAGEDYHAALFMGGASGEDYDRALMREGSALIEMVAIRTELEARKIDTRGVLAS